MRLTLWHMWSDQPFPDNRESVLVLDASGLLDESPNAKRFATAGAVGVENINKG